MHIHKDAIIWDVASTQAPTYRSYVKSCRRNLVVNRFKLAVRGLLPPNTQLPEASAGSLIKLSVVEKCKTMTSYSLLGKITA